MSSPRIAPSPAVSTPHGKPLRGLASTASSPLFQGRFGRLFRELPPGRYGATDAESRGALMLLGKDLTSDPDEPKDGSDPEESGIPALYTYFGQFVDHDLTYDPVSSLVARSDPDALTDFRTPAFDLDNLYGRGPDDQPYLYDNGPKFLPGSQLNNGARDLPRNGANPSRALIGDPRNDENSIVSQLQGLFLRFHNRTVDDHPSLTFGAVQQRVRFHYQWILLHDFLPRIVHSSVLEALKTKGEFDRAKLKFFHWKNDPFMPVEFSVCAYRFGHSMVRTGYRLNDDTLLPVFPTSNSSDSLRGFRTLPATYGIDWGRFIDIDKRSYGTDNPADPATRRRLQFAYRIDTAMVSSLAHLPPDVAADPPPSLPQRNLLRSFELGLPTGQAVARAMRVPVLDDEQIVIGQAVDNPEKGDVRGTIATLKQLAIFRDNCPLWPYVLAEAMQNREEVHIPVTENKKVSTPRLGPVGGRLVAEVFLGLLFGDHYSYLNLEPDWHPADRRDYRLKDFVNYAMGG